MDIPRGFITDPEKKVQGCALYVEMKSNSRDDSFYQFFLTPDGVNEEGGFVRAQMFKRRLTADAPKKQWRNAWLRSELLAEEMAELSMVQDAHNVKRFDTVASTLHRLMVHYTLVNKPFFVEVSKKDLSDIGIGKTPIKVVYRIGQTRKAMGFPEMFEEAK
jgi:hypothetical protein